MDRWCQHMVNEMTMRPFRVTGLRARLTLVAAPVCALVLGGCAARHVRTTGTDEFAVVYQKSSPRKAGDKAIIVMPPTGGSTRLEAYYRNTFRRAGFVVYVVESWSGMDEVDVELELHNRLLGRGQAAIDLILEQVEEPFVAILGTSVGGIHALTALGRSDRLVAGFVIGSAHPVASVIAWSELDALKELRQRRMGAFQWSTIDEYEAELLAAVHVEPSRYREALKRKALGAIVIRSDQTVKTRLQQNMVSDFAAQPVYRVSGSHVAGIIRAYWFHESDIVTFFDKAYDDWQKRLVQFRNCRIYASTAHLYQQSGMDQPSGAQSGLYHLPHHGPQSGACAQHSWHPCHAAW